MSKLNPMSAEALVAQANKLGLRIYTDQLFDSLQALSSPNRILNIEHKATRVMVAGDIQSRIEIYRFLTGWETALEFATEDWKNLKSPTEPDA